MVEATKRMVTQFSGVQLRGLFAELNEIIGDRERWRQLSESGEGIKTELLRRIAESARDDRHKLRLDRGLSLLASFHRHLEADPRLRLEDVNRVIIWRVGDNPGKLMNEWQVRNLSLTRTRTRVVQ